MLDTPTVIVDLDIMENNIKEMSNRAKKSNIKLRPHIKTHKSPYIALKQLEAGADGITVASLGEAEVMRRRGITDILIAFPVVGAKKLARLKALAKDTDVIVALDSEEVAKGISAIGVELNKKMPVYVEVDTGLGRCGNPYGEETVKLVEKLINIPNIEIHGLMTHAGHSYKSKNVEELREVSKQEGEYLVLTKEMIKEKLEIVIPEISVGSTPTAYSDVKATGVTEMRPGTYVFNDAGMSTQGVVEDEDCALSILATVVSVARKGQIIVDAGSKTLTSDGSPFREGFGKIVDFPNLKVDWITEEHGMIFVDEDTDLTIGDTIKIIPNHVCPTVNLTNEIYGVRNNTFERIITVEARGKNK